jgi:predicted small lipoprotein YifL
MIRRCFSPGRALVTASLIVLALAGCGRRGPLEAPLDPATAAQQRQREEIRRQRQGAATPGAAVAAQTEIPPIATARRSDATPPVPNEDDEEEEALPSSIAPTPIPTPTGGRKRGVVIPKTPFILDPLL